MSEKKESREIEGNAFTYIKDCMLVALRKKERIRALGYIEYLTRILCCKQSICSYTAFPV